MSDLQAASASNSIHDPSVTGMPGALPGYEIPVGSGVLNGFGSVPEDWQALAESEDREPLVAADEETVLQASIQGATTWQDSLGTLSETVSNIESSHLETDTLLGGEGEVLVGHVVAPYDPLLARSEISVEMPVLLSESGSLPESAATTVPLSNAAQSTLIAQGIAAALERLRQFEEDPEQIVKLQQAFGTGWNESVGKALLRQLSGNVNGTHPFRRIQVVPSESLPSQGAYEAATGNIYLYETSTILGSSQLLVILRHDEDIPLRI